MPYYKWRGVDLLGKTRRGKLFAQSREELDRLLIKREIALLGSKKARFFLLRSINLSDKIHFFKQLTALLSSGILLPDALRIIKQQIAHPYFQEVIDAIAKNIQEGASIKQAFNNYANIFEPLMINVLHVGQESGELAQSCELLCDYLSRRYEFKKKLSSAAFLPLLTLGFFIIISLIIFIVIIPQFATMFASVNQELPLLTSIMLRISSFFSSWAALGYFGIIFLLLTSSYFWAKQKKEIFDRFILHVPLINKIMVRTNQVQFLRALSLLIQGGMPLIIALQTARMTIFNSVLREQLLFFESEVKEGNSLSHAMLADPHQQFGPAVISLVATGQESGRLVSMLQRAADLCQRYVERQLSLFSHLFQPLLMLVLGILITMLIFAVYLPIINLSHVI